MKKYFKEMNVETIYINDLKQEYKFAPVETEAGTMLGGILKKEIDDKWDFSKARKLKLNEMVNEVLAKLDRYEAHFNHRIRVLFEKNGLFQYDNGKWLEEVRESRPEGRKKMRRGSGSEKWESDGCWSDEGRAEYK
jgi:hypothetical protein